MIISLFFVSVLLASFFLLRSVKKKKRQDITLSILLSLASIAFLGLYIHKNHTIIVHATTSIFTKGEELKKEEILQQQTSNFILNEPNILRDEVQLEAPLIKQLPELPRGCELVSLGMLLAFNDIHVDKLELADNVKRNPAVFERRDGKTYFGNPNNGFVGDMLALNTPGLGVYHKPIAELAEQYAEDLTIYDFTGEDFSEVKEQLSMGRPVWVIINSHYSKLPESEFITWHTEDGPIDITYREHSVLITGYDEENIYFNDPLDYQDSASKENFIEAWVQMGKQAITIY
ncbi:C39 family peptidase [Pseudogracilibacillus auburnensis]|uniref:C39 family peptidase n=1 Tax=Pseudogracilibacillus auburnensis TaxID=1494959 RepID=UPI001F60BCB2|nr:C39 family peptidase [Pseudogracilibacillus auburnensis]